MTSCVFDAAREPATALGQDLIGEPANQGILFGMDCAEPDGYLAVQVGAVMRGSGNPLVAKAAGQPCPRGPAIPGGLLLADLTLDAPYGDSSIKVLLDASFHFLRP
jgi:hypothetical protein